MKELRFLFHAFHTPDAHHAYKVVPLDHLYAHSPNTVRCLRAIAYIGVCYLLADGFDPVNGHTRLPLQSLRSLGDSFQVCLRLVNFYVRPKSVAFPMIVKPLRHARRQVFAHD